MNQTIEWALFDLNAGRALDFLFHLGIAYVLAFALGWERESNDNTAGLRTFPLVAMASCAYTMAGVAFLSSTGAEARVIQAIIAGMGFIGGGAILKNNDKAEVSGTATAASLWITGAIGMTVALNMLEIAIILSVITFLTLQTSRILQRDS